MPFHRLERLSVLAGLGMFFGLGTAAAAAPAPDILIGLSSPITGPAATPAEWEQQGVRLAMAQINQAGGLLGRQIRLEVLDNRCNPSEAVNVANRLVEDHVVAIIGAHCSSATLATMPIIQAAKIPLIGGVASSPKISELSGTGGNIWTFRINPSDQDMMDALGEYLSSSTQFRHVAAVAEDTDFGRGGVAAFAPVAKAHGITVISTDYYQQNQPDFTTILTRIQRARPDAIALFQLAGDQLNLLRNAMQMGLTLPYTGRAELGGKNVQIIAAGGMNGSVSAWGYSEKIAAPENQAFVAAIIAQTGSIPYLQTWAGYDSMRVLANAIRAAGSTDPARIRDAMQQVDMTNVMGRRLHFDAQNQAGKSVAILGVQKNAVQVLGIVDLK